jgi:predicted PurR-regulated permease PerM
MRAIKITKKRILDILLILISLIIVIGFWNNFSRVISPFIYALILAYILNPLVNFFESKRIKRRWAVLIVFAIILILLSLFFALVIPNAVGDLTNFIRDIPNIVNFLQDWFNDLRSGNFGFILEEMEDFINLDEQLNNISEYIRSSLENIVSFLVASTATLFELLMTPIITFYYLKDKEKMLGIVSKLIPEKIEPTVYKLGSDINRILSGFIRGQLIIALIIGVLTGIAAAILRVPYAITIGIQAGITNIIPYFGPWIGGILPVILALMISPVRALWMVIAIVVIQQGEGDLISPQIMSRSVGLHPLLVMFSVLFFGSIFGIVGMVAGVPLMASLITIGNYIIEYRKKLKDSPVTIE